MLPLIIYLKKYIQLMCSYILLFNGLISNSLTLTVCQHGDL